VISDSDDVLSWLLEGPPWISYAVETQLLDRRRDPSDVLNDPDIKAVVDRLKANSSGFPALGTGTLRYNSGGNVYWDLSFLADIGLSISQLGLEVEVEGLFDLQRDDGSFILQEGTRSSYLCISSIILSSLARMGYAEDPRLLKFIDLALGQQRLDGGWHCAISRAKGNKLQETESCPMDNQNLLLLFGQYASLKEEGRMNGAVGLLLEHWARRAEHWRPYGFGIGSQFMKVRYPETKYGLLKVLDVLSLYPYAVRQLEYQEMLGALMNKSNGGRYSAESISRSYSKFDFGQARAPSRWITFLVNRIIKRSNAILKNIV